jgi:hypothetical protein
MLTQRDQIHQVVWKAGRPLSDQEIVDDLGVGGHTPTNTVRRDLNEAGHFQRGVDGRWAPPEWRGRPEFTTASVEGNTVDVAKLVTPPAGMETYVAHQTIRNIVVSYESGTDPIAEAVQNAFDAVDDGGLLEVSYDPASGQLVVDDKGQGLTRDQFAQLVRPNVSTKQAGSSVGYKGVGLTFLCFSSDAVEVSGDGWVACIDHARQWVDDPFGWRWPSQPAVRFVDGPARSGVRYQALLHPRAQQHLTWITTPGQLALALRTHTTLGALEPPKTVRVTAVVPGAGPNHCSVPQRPLLPTEAVPEAERLNLADADGKPQPSYEGVWRTWATDELRSLISTRRGSHRQEHSRLSEIIKESSIRAYGYLAKNRESLVSLGDGDDGYSLLGAHGARVFARNQPLSRPPLPVRLTASTGYFNRLWIRLDVDAEADIGRKSLPAIEHDLQEIASVVGAELIRAGTPWLYTEGPEIRSRGDEETRRRQKYCWRVDGDTIDYWDIRDEQDVVALYNRFTGVGLLAHLPVVASWGSTGVYDARAFHNPDAVHPQVAKQSSGVQEAGGAILRLEFKLHARDLIRDVEKGKKSFANIDLVVAWDVGRWPETHEWELISAQQQQRPRGERIYAGVTHLIRHKGTGDVLTRVIALKDFLAPFAE